MELNYVTIAVATGAQFLVGAIWYTFLFGKLWGKIHGFDKLSKETQEKMMKSMGPMYGVQLLVTVISTVVLAIFINNLPGWNAYGMAVFFWLGFVMPAQVSAVIFGGTEGKWIVKKLGVQTFEALIRLLVAAAILSNF